MVMMDEVLPKRVTILVLVLLVGANANALDEDAASADRK